MGKCRFILVRHGQSEGNLRDEFLGHTDLPLTELGHKQAECTATYLEGYDIDVLYASDLKRAYMTAEHIAEHKQLSIIADTQFREVYAGKWEGLAFATIYEKYRADFDVWLHDMGKARCTDGESVAELYKRVTAEVERLAKLNEGQTVCVATHATPIKCVRLKALGYSVENAKEIGWTSNASVTIVDVDAESGEFTMVTDGYDEHLADLRTALPTNV